MMLPPSPRERGLPSAPACVVLIGCFLVATFIVGWWGIPIVSVIWSGWASRARRWNRGVAPAAAGGAVVAWGALLGWTAVTGPLGRLTNDLGALTRIPGAAFIALTLAFAALLGWSGAALGTRD